MAAPAFSADTIKLGVAGPQSGDLASYGIPTVRAAQFVVKEINAKGGVLGKKVEKPETIATAIRIGNPASWQAAVAARDESGGKIEAVTDEEILQAYSMIALTEGIFCEPASAASLAGVLKLNREGYFSQGDCVVCTLTGNGLKDPDTVFKVAKKPAKSKATLDAVEGFIKEIL